MSACFCGAEPAFRLCANACERGRCASGAGAVLGVCGPQAVIDRLPLHHLRAPWQDGTISMVSGVGFVGVVGLLG